MGLGSSCTTNLLGVPLLGMPAEIGSTPRTLGSGERLFLASPVDNGLRSVGAAAVVGNVRAQTSAPTIQRCQNTTSHLHRAAGRSATNARWIRPLRSVVVVRTRP